jgi:hypothetical protein
MNHFCEFRMGRMNLLRVSILVTPYNPMPSEIRNNHAYAISFS